MNISKSNATICRWTGRIVGSFLAFIIVFIASAQGVPNPWSQPAPVQIGLLGLALIVTGIVAGWGWELSGGIVSLAGWCLFLVPVSHSPRSMTGFVTALAVPGALYITSALLRRAKLRPPSHLGSGFNS